MNMDPKKPNSSQAVSPLTIAVVDEDTKCKEPCTEDVANVCSTSIPNTPYGADTVKKPRAKWRKPEDKPHHPRTGYNFFFQLERERMLLGIDHLPILPQDVINLPVGGSRLTTIKSYQDGSDQTVHPRALTGEKLGFADLARNVASKWKKLDSSIKQLFEEKAERERVRYRNELEEWNALQRNKKLLEESPDALTSTLSESIQIAPNTSHRLPAAQSSHLDQQRSGFLPMKRESDHREFRQDVQDQITLRQILLENGASPNGKSWQHSPQRSHTEAFGEKLLRQLTQAKVISPPESRVRATSLNFYPNDSRAVPSSKSDLSSKINRFIEEVCTVSEDLHHLAKRGSLDQRLSPQLREIEHQVEFCTTEFHRLSSQVKDFFRSYQDESIIGQYNSQRNQMQQANQFPNESIRDPYHHGFDIPSLLKEVRNVRSLLDCSEYQLDDVTDNRSRNAPPFYNDHCTTRRINSDSVVVQPSPRRVSNMDESNQFVRNMNEISRGITENASVFDSVDGYRLCTSQTEPAVQGDDRSSQQNVAESVQTQHESRPSFSTLREVGITVNGHHHDALQRRYRHFVQRFKNGITDDTLVESSLDFGDDGSVCDMANMECDTAFDLEPMFPSYQAL